MRDFLVSIGLLTYNHENYISDALESLLSQTYEQIELIILDDASTDNTTLAIERYMERLKKRFVRVVYLKNEKNCGNIPHNCNRLIRESRGDFYYEISGDDVLLADGIRSLYEALQSHSECMMVHANMIWIPDRYHFGDGMDVQKLYWKNRDSQVEADNFFQKLMYDNRIAAPTVMRNRKVFIKHGYHDENYIYEDYEYWLRISQKERVYYLNKPVALYRKAITSITNYEGNDAKIQIGMEARFFAKEKYIRQLGETERVECWRNYFTSYIRICHEHQYHAGLKWLKERMEKLGMSFEECLENVQEATVRGRKESELLEVLAKEKKVSHMLGQYLRDRKINKIAIYGYSRLGAAICRELAMDGISVEYVIDRKGKMLECPWNVYTMEDVLPLVDAVVVAPAGLYQSIVRMLEEKTRTRIINLERTLKELEVGDESAEQI